jgi:hypothetical protein
VTLILDANPGRFTAQVFRSAAPDPASLVDAEVKLRGIAATRFNTRGEATGSRVIVGSRNDLIVIKPPPPPDAIPLVELNRLLPFRPDPIGPHRVRVEGTVTFSLPGRFFCLQEGNNAIRVETVSQLLMKPGDRVEAAGFVEISRGIGSLKDATVRKIGASGFPEPMTISPEEILAFNRSTGKRTRPHDYDGHVIRCRARLLAVQSELYGRPLRTLTLERPDLKAPGRSLVFRALLSDGDTQALDLLRPASELEVTGLVQLD